MPSSPSLCWRTLTARSALLAVVAAGALLAAGCGGSEQRETDAPWTLGEPVEDSTIAALAEVSGFTDTLAREAFQRNMNRLTQGRLRMLPDTIKQRVQRVALVQFLTFTAALQEANERGIEVDSAAVSQQFRRSISQMGGDSLFQARLAQSGLTRSQLRENIREQLMIRNLQRQIAQDVEDPTEEEISTYRSDAAREVRAQQILFQLPPGATQAQRDSVRLRAQTVLDSIQSGTIDFAAAAQRYGQGGGDEAGSLGYQTRQQMAAPFVQRGQQPAQVPFVQAAFALSDSGDVASEPVRTRYGFHLIRQTGARTGQLMDSARAGQQLRRERQQEAITTALEDLRENVTLRINPSHVTADMSQPLDQAQGEEAGAS